MSRRSKYESGSLDQRITIKREQSTPDGLGGNNIALVDVATVWAMVKALRGSERYDNPERLDAKATYRFVIRWRDDIQERDRIVWNGIDYNIRSILDNSRRTLFLEFEAERGVAQ